ncbi:MAG: molybdopterin-dependent oxidoreductase [Halothiobacillaceae bacterium]|nr:molybdopterin-dependent oxidoreductase [Halothiobacillaceae bacterium]
MNTALRQTVKTTCPYCGVGCGVLAEQNTAGAWSVRGDPAHPANFGRLCSKGAALAETIELPDRLTTPLARQADGALHPIAWDAALDRIATGFRTAIAEFGSESVGIYVSGQILTEDYYVANKLMKGFIGSANIDTNSRLCMSSAVAAYNRAFGSDTVPVSYEDLECADLVVLIGSNTAYAHPVIYQRLVAAKERRPEMKFVVIDPRRTATCDIADLHLAIAPGADTFLLNGLLVALADAGKIDAAFIEQSVDGFDAALAAARIDAPDLATLAQRCGLPAAEVRQFFDWFIAHERTVSLWSQGLNQSASGTDKGNALINCHLVTGRIGKPAMGPFSITGQPNAMGGREVGGLANQLAAHQGFTLEAIDRVGRFWGSANVAQKAGLKAVDLFAAAATGQIKVLWIIATNPVFSLPDSTAVRAALSACPLVILSECVSSTDTAAYADLLLPATGWGERDGTVTNSERRISRQLPIQAAAGHARHDWQVLCAVAQRLGFGRAFDFPNAAAVFREYAALTAFENNGSRDLDLGGLAHLTDAQYDALVPTRWPQPAQGQPAEPFADGLFFTPNRRAKMWAITAQGAPSALTPAYPLRLNTGRLRDQWHGMSRTGAVPKLLNHVSEPTLNIHPIDAARFKLRGHHIARIGNARGSLLARVMLDDSQRQGSVFVPMHWSDAFSRSGLVNAVITADLDPVSGQPEFKTQAVWVEPYPARWYGFILIRLGGFLPDLSPLAGDYAAKIPTLAATRVELAGITAPEDWSHWAKCALNKPGTAPKNATEHPGNQIGDQPGDPREWIEFKDPANGRFRAAQLTNGQLDWVIAITDDSRAVDTQWLAGLFAESTLTAAQRADLIAGKPAGAQADTGPVICACFSLGRNTLVAAIQAHKLADAKALGVCTQAGTNCGSCLPELKALIAHTQANHTQANQAHHVIPNLADIA